MPNWANWFRRPPHTPEMPMPHESGPAPLPPPPSANPVAGAFAESGLPIAQGLPPGAFAESVVPHMPYVRKLDDLGFFSKAIDEAQKLRNPKASPQEYINKLQKQGVKKEELQAHGLIDEAGKLRPDWENIKSISKEDFIQRLEENKPGLETTRRGYDATETDTPRKLSDDDYQSIIDRASNDFYDQMYNNYSIEHVPDHDSVRDYYDSRYRPERYEDANGEERWRLVDVEDDTPLVDDFASERHANNHLEEMIHQEANDTDVFPNYHIIDGNGREVERLPDNLQDGRSSRRDEYLHAYIQNRMEDIDIDQWARENGYQDELEAGRGSPGPEFDHYMNKYMQNPDTYAEQLIGVLDRGGGVRKAGGDRWPGTHWSEDYDPSRQLLSIAREHVEDAEGRKGLRILETQSDATKNVIKNNVPPDGLATWADHDARVQEEGLSRLVNARMSAAPRGEINPADMAGHMASQARLAELRQKYDTTPFLSRKSMPYDMAARAALYEAAKNGMDFVTWPRGEEIAGRWNQPSLAENYDKALSQGMVSSARMHDQKVKQGHANYSKPPSWSGETSQDNPTWTFDTIPGEHPDQPTLPGIEPRRPMQLPESVTWSNEAIDAGEGRPTGVGLTEWRNSGALSNPSYGIFDAEGNLLTQGGPMAAHGPMADHGGRDAADTVLSAMQRHYDDIQSGRTQMPEQPQNPAIYFTPQMRESILKNGFPMFANPPTAGLVPFMTGGVTTTGGFEGTQ